MKNFPRQPDRDYSISNAEIRLRDMLTSSGYQPQTDKRFCLQETWPDFYYYGVNLAIYLDGPPHLKQHRELKDIELRDKLKRIHSCTVREYPYKKNTLKEIVPIHDSIINNIVGLRKMMK